MHVFNERCIILVIVIILNLYNLYLFLIFGAHAKKVWSICIHHDRIMRMH